MSGLSFNKDKMAVNADGNLDVYVGPRAPVRLKSNRIPTMGKKPYVWLRLYGPDDAY